MLRSVDFKFPVLAVNINTESGDIIHIVHMVAHKMKEFVDFNSRIFFKSQCMDKYSIINTINKKVLGHISTCLQSKVWGCLHPHFFKMGDRHFDGEIRYISLLL